MLKRRRNYLFVDSDRLMGDPDFLAFRRNFESNLDFLSLRPNPNPTSIFSRFASI